MKLPIFEYNHNSTILYANVASLMSADQFGIVDKYGNQVSEKDRHNEKDLRISFYGRVITQVAFDEFVGKPWIFILNDNGIIGRPTSNAFVQYINDNGEIRKRKISDWLDITFISKDVENLIRREISYRL